MSGPVIPGTENGLHVDATTMVLLGNAKCSTHLHADHAEAINIGFLLVVGGGAHGVHQNLDVFEKVSHNHRPGCGGSASTHHHTVRLADSNAQQVH